MTHQRDDHDEDPDIDVCMGCGTYYGTHWGLENWVRPEWPKNDVAPQLCGRCWRAEGYYWPEPPPCKP